MKSAETSSSMTSSTGTSSVVSNLGSNDSDDPLNENFITLLRYRDAYHILGLDHPDGNDNNAANGIDGSDNDATSSQRIKSAYMLRRQETLVALQKCNEGKVNTFIMSQLNYLELKLRALDQAKAELLGDTASFEEEEDDEKSVIENGSVDHAQDDIDQDDESLLQDTAFMKDDDELDTIDIYFQPHPSYSRPQRARKLSKDSADLSSVSWLSKADSDDNLSQVLGPLKKKDNSSPRGVADFPNQGYAFDEKPSRSDRDLKSVAQRPPKPTYQKRSKSQTQTIEAARKGVLRALSEDDSECLSLDDYDDAIVMKILEKALKDNMEIGDSIREVSEHRERDNNSPVKSIKSQKSEHSYRSGASSKRSKSSQRSRPSGTSSKPSSIGASQSRSRPNTPTPTVKHEEDEYAQIDKLIHTEDDYYDSILQSGIELAEDICGVFHSCFWDTDGGVNNSLEVDKSDARVSNDRGFNKEEESVFSDEYTLGTDGESTAFNTTSSFGHVPGAGTPESYFESRYREKKRLV